MAREPRLSASRRTSTPLLFWRWWPTPDRAPLMILLAAVLAALGWYAVQTLWEDRGAVRWEVQTTLDHAPVVTDAWEHPLGTLPQEAETYLVTQRQVPADLQLMPWWGAAAVVAVWAALLVLLTVATLWPSWGYFGTVAVVLAYLATAKLELLGVFGTSGTEALIGAIAVLGGASYYLYAFATRRPLWWRLLVMLVAGGGVLAALALGATAPYPLFALANFGNVVPLLLALLFVALVAVDLPVGLLVLTTRAGRFGPGKPLLHFTVLTAVYVLNVVLSYLRARSRIDWDLLYPDAFLLLAAATVIGLWNFALKEPLYRRLMSFRPAGAWTYAALALAAWGAVAYYRATDNDPMLEAFEDMILLAFAAWGIFFFFYVLLNFGPALRQGLPVHRVVFEPLRVPYLGVHLFAVLAVFAVVLNARLFPYYQARAGLTIGTADAFRRQGDVLVAEQYYEQARAQEGQNHRVNYALATLARTADERAEATSYFEAALGKVPTEEAWVGLSETYQRRSRFFDALFTLQAANEAFPESAPVANNLAMLYYGTGILDSTYYFLQAAQARGGREESRAVAATNLLAFFARQRLIGEVETADEVDRYDTRAFLANVAAVRAAGGDLTVPDDVLEEAPKDSVIDNVGFVYVYNWALAAAGTGDTSWLAPLGRYQSHPRNEPYAADLLFAQAALRYAAGHADRALPEMIRAQQLTSALGGAYARTLGLWFLRLGAPRTAANWFEEAIASGKDARVPMAIALTDARRTDVARRLWIGLLDSDREEVRTMAAQSLRALGSAPDTLYRLAEPFRAVALTAHPDLTTGQRIALWRSLTPTFRYWGGARLAAYFLDEDQPDAAATVADALTNPPADLPVVVRHDALTAWGRVQAQRGNFDALRAVVDSLPEGSGWRAYFEGRISYENGDTVATRRAWEAAYARRPLTAEIIVALADLDQAQGRGEEGYERLRTSLALAPYDRTLREAYILKALERGLTSFAASSFERYGELYPEREAFRRRYEAALEAAERAFETF
ncbi:MAG: hypothetical protein WBA12_08030 [Catalinimonas sp.]